MKRPPPADTCAALVADLLRDPRVSVGAGKRRGFGADALTTGGKIFALRSSKDRFVVKLPRARVDALVAAGRGARFDPGHGRLMREWLELAPGSEASWGALAGEALDYVSGAS